MADHGDDCLHCKLKYWREHGMPTPTFSSGRKDFHELPSVHQRERDHVAELKAAGIDFDRAPR